MIPAVLRSFAMMCVLFCVPLCCYELSCVALYSVLFCVLPFHGILFCVVFLFVFLGEYSSSLALLCVASPKALCSLVAYSPVLDYAVL